MKIITLIQLKKLSDEAIKLRNCLIELDRKTKGYRISKILFKASERSSRRLKRVIKEEKKEVEKLGVGRPKKKDKKVQLGIKLPPYLIAWLKRQPESNAELVEKALCEYYQIPEGIK